MLVTMAVEIPRGSRNKYEMDPDTGPVHLDRMLFTATRYPADYGFVPDTVADDGDPLDAMALVTEPTFPGCRIHIRPVGLFLMEDQGLPDHKVLGVPVRDPMWGTIRSIDELPSHLLREFEHFFSVYKDLEDMKTAALGWKGPDDALKVLETAGARLEEEQ
ncbi:MAG TPA: inorganic diphosphatase [Acidimicrobiia bacterium]|nr:inorganic diphosphatase [Acidimicrobiia bacterium]